EAGEELTIGFIGGSITQGSGASKYDNCYAHRVFNWFVETFPQSTFKEVNAGIGATTSELGAARIQEDLLSYKPDFVVLEFSVNDSDSFFYARTYEGCVRQILTAENAPALITLNMVQYNDGVNAQIKHSAVSKNYSVPEVSMKNSVYVEITKGNIEASDVSKDMLHPNDLGHEYTAKCVTYYLSKILDGTYSSEADTEIPSVIYEGNAFLSSVRLNNKSITNGVAKGAGLSNFAVELNGFEEDTAVQNGVSDCFKNGWSAKEEGASITLTGLKGSRIALLYQRKPSMKSANAIAILDGDEANAVSLDGNFENGWGNWLYLDDNGAFEDLDPSVEHTVEIRIVEAGEQDFYLASVLVSGIEK
ncbi:MAG TPA: SGNH/GDSL hydrolase family protein, partial [Lachnospiraceae bacterium]|nr:SGNH/GDSL hydrolase family protein [Lachnospiraceae bacterium]